MRASKTIWSRLSVWTLIASNLVPLYGVVMHGWSVFPIMLLFWLENVVIGVMNVLRMLVAEPPEQQGASASQGTKLFMIPFFCVHYGMFTFVHGIFVFSLFAGPVFEHADTPGEMWEALTAAVRGWHLGLALLGLVASHIVSFVTNFLGRGEYKRYSLGQLLFQPYGRVVILHLTILGGGFLATALGSPTWALVVLVVLKIIVDLGAHLWIHRDPASEA